MTRLFNVAVRTMVTMVMIYLLVGMVERNGITGTFFYMLGGNIILEALIKLVELKRNKK